MKEGDLKFKDLMRELNCSRQTLRNLLEERGVNFYRLSNGPKGQIRIPRAEVYKLRAPSFF